MGEIIRTIGLTKDFGNVRAVDHLDLEVHRGEIFGFLGPNGAGKSTTIRLLLDLIRPTAGTAEVFGRAANDRGPALRAEIGYLPGELRMPEGSTAAGYLGYLASLRKGRGGAHISDLAERFSLDLAKPIGKLSKGNKQKVGVIQAFMHQPELLILDEPTSGLDPLLQHEFHDLVTQRCAEGATVFMSSHVLSEIQDIAQRVAVIRSGRLVDVDDLKTLRQKAGQEVELRFAESIDAERFSSLAGLSEVSVTVNPQTGGSVLNGVLRGEPDRLLKVAAAYHVTGWNAADRELEDLFLDFYRDSPGQHDD